MKEKGVLSMTDKKILDRDRIGICTEGECRDRVRELEEELQAKMKEFDVETTWFFGRTRLMFGKG
jgi:hypothetical protein